MKAITDMEAIAGLLHHEKALITGPGGRALQISVSPTGSFRIVAAPPDCLEVSDLKVGDTVKRKSDGSKGILNRVDPTCIHPFRFTSDQTNQQLSCFVHELERAEEKTTPKFKPGDKVKWIGKGRLGDGYVYQVVALSKEDQKVGLVENGVFLGCWPEENLELVHYKPIKAGDTVKIKAPCTLRKDYRCDENPPGWLDRALRKTHVIEATEEGSAQHTGGCLYTTHEDRELILYREEVERVEPEEDQPDNYKFTVGEDELASPETEEQEEEDQEDDPDEDPLSLYCVGDYVVLAKSAHEIAGREAAAFIEGPLSMLEGRTGIIREVDFSKSGPPLTVEFCRTPIYLFPDEVALAY